MMAQSDDANRIDEWLAVLGGPGAGPQGPEARERCVAEMCVAGADRLFPALVPRLTCQDPEVRCAACEDHLPPIREMQVPTLDRDQIVVRSYVGGLVKSFERRAA